MNHALRERLASIDWVLTGAIILLVSFGLTMLFSTTSEDALFSSLFIRQSVSLAIAIAVYAAMSLFPYHKLRRYTPSFYGAGLLVLIVLWQVGQVIRGATSRLSLFGVQVQPSEFMKIAIILLLAHIFSKHGANARTLGTSVALVGAASVLIFLEPDTGEAALIAAVWAALVVFLGTPWRYLLIGLTGAVAGGALAWRWLFAQYQKERILTFLDPTGDPLGAGYNIMQSLVAFGSGGWLGRGLGHGPQSQLKFLPEQHTDFVLASIGEELGFIGVAVVVALYSVVLWRVLRIARRTRDPFGQYLAVGAYLLLLISFFISAGMNIGLLPVTGIPLPLVSYGGSNLVSTFILLGIVQSVYLYSTWVRTPPSELTHF